MLVDFIFDLPRNIKRTITLFTDLTLLTGAFIVAAFASKELGTIDLQVLYYLGGLTILCSIPFLAIFGLYHSVVRFMGDHAILAIIKSAIASALLVTLFSTMLLDKLSVGMSLIFLLSSFLAIGGSRFTVRHFYERKHRKIKQEVVIYGAGASGTQLMTALRRGAEYEPIAFIDDKRSLQNNTVDGTRVYPLSKLESVLKTHNVKVILLAIPSASRERRAEILEKLEKHQVRVKTIPGLADLVDGIASIEQVRDIEIEELLGRDPVKPNEKLLKSCIEGKNVLVTGAGGSIGSELCRQIFKLKPSTIILFDSCEFGLYSIEQEINKLKIELNLKEHAVVSLLGSVQDGSRLRSIISTFSVHTIYHAAAYKHVPMIEHNIIDGVRNNVYGTLFTAQAARANNVETFVLISTDKAVRPTNVMGATKRLAELIVQGLSQLKGDTTFCMVRFGNVLGSSGSVVPLFKEQIKNKGPLTVTHPEIIRYFMTIPEAAQLVIQASSLANGGDVFVLDMGEPVKIADLAKKMVHLMGLEIKDERNPKGDIEIQYSGLRCGEKLYEELLIGDNVTGTEHPRIMQAEELALDWHDLEKILADLDTACQHSDYEKIRNILINCDSGYAPHDNLADHIYCNYDNAKQQKEKARVISVFQKVSEKAII